MIVTEDEARLKLCPFARNFNADETHNTVSAAPTCIGSGCMAWNWFEFEYVLAYKNTLPTDLQPPDAYSVSGVEEWEAWTGKMKAAGWTLTEGSNPRYAGSWTKPNLARKGQCLRVVTVS